MSACLCVVFEQRACRIASFNALQSTWPIMESDPAALFYRSSPTKSLPPLSSRKH